MKKKWLTVGVTLLFVGTCLISVTAEENERQTFPSSKSGWLYVGGNGPGNYTRIQNAIDTASDGDTVFVYAGMYHENITVYHAITVIGENRDTTIIDGDETNNVVTIVGNGIVFSGFTVQNSTLAEGAGIQVDAYGGSVEISEVHVTDNSVGIFLGSGTGIQLHDSIIDNNTETGVYVHCSQSDIQDNFIMDNGYFGIMLLGEKINDTHITNNLIGNHRQGIWVSDMFDTSRIQITDNIIMNSSQYGITMEATDSKILGNRLDNNSIALYLMGGQRNDIRDNTFCFNHQGVVCIDGGNHRIHRNNFLQNQEDAFFTYFRFVRNERNFWYHNYWDGHNLPTPKLIKGQKIFPFPYSWGNISWVQFDMLPAFTPFDVPGLR